MNRWIEITVYYYFGSDSSASRYILETFFSPGVQGISSSFPQPKKKKNKAHTHTQERGKKILIQRHITNSTRSLFKPKKLSLNI